MLDTNDIYFFYDEYVNDKLAKAPKEGFATYLFSTQNRDLGTSQSHSSWGGSRGGALSPIRSRGTRVRGQNTVFTVFIRLSAQPRISAHPVVRKS